MCLFIEVLLPGIPASEAGKITKAAAAGGYLELHAKRQRRGAIGSRFFVSEPRQGCACSLAAEEADWKASHYALRSEIVDSLARTFEFLLDRAGPEGAFVRAAWVSDAYEALAASQAPPVVPAVLLADLRRARMANNHVYRVRGTAA